MKIDLEPMQVVTVVVDIAAGIATVVYGLSLLPSYLALPWILFNTWLWSVTPIVLIWANKKENEKKDKGRD